MRITKSEVEIRLPDGDRTGWHVSQVVRGIGIQAGIIDDRYNDRRDVLWMVGLGWEQQILGYEEARTGVALVPQHTMTLDGITGTADAVEVAEGAWGAGIAAVHECKWTEMKMVAVPEELAGPRFWSWVTQIKAYCWMAGTSNAVLHVCWAKGDYVDRWPGYGRYEFSFEPGELEDTWAMMVRWVERQEGR